MIEAHSLTKRYGALTAVDNVSFQISEGENPDGFHPCDLRARSGGGL